MLHDMKPIWTILLLLSMVAVSIVVADYATKECKAKGGTLKMYGKVMQCEY